MTDQEIVFIDQLLAELPFNTTKKLVDDLQVTLGVKRTAAYNRVQHRVNFTIQDILKICETHHISLDSVIYKDKVDEVPHSFYSDALRSMPRTYMDYISNIHNHVKVISNMPEVELTMILNEFSILHLLGYDHLMYLRLFVWNLASWNMAVDFENYTPESILDNMDYHEKTKAILKVYNNTTTYEIWTPDLFENLTKLVHFVRSTGIIDDRHLDGIKNDMMRLYHNLEKSLNTGQKWSIGLQEERAPRTVWLNETIRTNEMLLVSSIVGSSVFTMYDTPNYIRTVSRSFCDHSFKWVDKIKEQSTQITQSAKLKKMALLRKYKNDIISGFE